MKTRHSASRCVALILLLWGAAALHAAESYREPWRPQFHFTPATNWMNDPNGMVFYDGEYHLFYQFNPFGDKWGHMSWGHAVSRDLVRWEHLPVALYEENGVMIFSGSAVVDWKNTSGFGRDGKPPMIALYTGHHTTKPLQNQHLAFSNDKGRTWTKYSANPVLDIGEKDFRDPKVFWHEPTQRWVMAVAWPVERKVRFYSSPNLKDWTHQSDFGPAGSTNGIWECPDLFPLRVEGRRGTEKWALIVNVGSGAPAGGSGCQYFVGDFDGKEFKPARAASEPALWADWGRDFYAAVSWSDIPKRDGRRLWLGWMSNWEYANDVPTSPWRSAMSLPRELSLRQTPGGLRLIQRPVRELARLRGKSHHLGNSAMTEANAWLEGLNLGSDLLEIAVEFDSVPDQGELVLRLVTGTNESTAIRYQASSQRLSVDRTRSGRVDFHPKFGGTHEAPVRVTDGRLRLHLWLDASSIEVFGADGETVLTDLILRSSGRCRLELVMDPAHHATRLRRLDVWELRSAW
ncbi:MAG: glycoside hydrolase family 32 protein [Verrucomicrobiales bacterium]|nr:glycoside hydrolase family 32 protein [Verrucomicrobiales bacterium]